MNAFIKKISYATFTLFLLIGLEACHPSKSDEESPPPPSIEPAPAPAEQPPATVNPLTANRWCRAEDWDDFQVVMRMTLKEDHMLTEYLRLTPTGFDVYQYSQRPPWELKDQMASVPNKILVNLHENSALISTLPGFPEQKRIFDEIFSQNALLSHPEGGFAPPKAMTTLTRVLATGFEIERNVYPCENYSSTFNGEGPIRPLLELILTFALNSKGYTAEGRGTVAASMPFAYPVEEVKIQQDSIANTQWCSWREVAAGELLLRTLTIGTNTFVENAHTQLFAGIADELEQKKYLNENAARSEKYSFEIKGDRLTGKNLTPLENQPKNLPQELFAMIVDANGMKALMRMDAIEPDRTWPVFSDLYFHCQDIRPLQFSPAFQIRLPDILALQMQQLQQL